MNPARTGFTIVELVIVIGIVLLLAGLTLAVGSAVARRADTQRTEGAMQLLDQAVREWETSAGRRLTWWHHDDPDDWASRADVHANTTPVLIITEMLDVVARSPTSREMLAGIDDELVYRYGPDDPAAWLDTSLKKSQVNDRFVGGLTILDAWGTPVYATHPGRPYRTGVDDTYEDRDGTIRTSNEMDYGIAPNRRIVFVSAGPDGLFGIAEEFAHVFGPERYELMHEARRDNLYTVPVTYPQY